MAAEDLPPAKRARVEKEPLLVDDILALEASKKFWDQDEGPSDMDDI